MYPSNLSIQLDTLIKAASAMCLAWMSDMQPARMNMRLGTSFWPKHRRLALFLPHNGDCSLASDFQGQNPRAFFEFVAQGDLDFFGNAGLGQD